MKYAAKNATVFVFRTTPADGAISIEAALAVGLALGVAFAVAVAPGVAVAVVLGSRVLSATGETRIPGKAGGGEISGIRGGATFAGVSGSAGGARFFGGAGGFGAARGGSGARPTTSARMSLRFAAGGASLISRRGAGFESISVASRLAGVESGTGTTASARGLDA